MKICGVDKSKHSRIPFQFPLVAPLFVRSPLDEFVVIINGVYKWSALHNPLVITILCRSSRKIVYRRLKKKKKKKDRWNRANITRNRSPVSLPSFLLVGMHQNVCRLPGSVSIRFVWKFTRGGPGWIFVRRMIALITSIFSYRIMLIFQNFPTSRMMKKIR